MDEEMMLENALYPWLDDASMEAQDGGEEMFSSWGPESSTEDSEYEDRQEDFLDDEYEYGGEG